VQQQAASPDEAQLWEDLEALRLIHQRDRGDATPGEALITRLLTVYAAKGRLDLKDASVIFEEFRDNWDFLADMGKVLGEQYPDLVASGRS